jgi:hypothetical protein
MADVHTLQFYGEPISEVSFLGGLWKEKEVVAKHPFTYKFTLENIGKDSFPGGTIPISGIHFGGFGPGIEWNNEMEMNIPPLAPNQSSPFSFDVPYATQKGPAVLYMQVFSNDNKIVIVFQSNGGAAKDDPATVGVFNVIDESEVQNRIYTWIALLLALGGLISNVIVGIIQILIAKGKI